MKMTRWNKNLRIVVIAMAGMLVPAATCAAFSWLKAASAGYKTYKAMSLSDEDVVEYVKQGVKQMDRSNTVMSSSSPYTTRLNKLTAGFKKVNGIPLNFKVYKTNELNAFACADGSVRVYSKLMDVMTDEELLGIIGHEIGHVGLHHSRKQIKRELLTGALRDAISSSDGRAGMLAQSSLGAMGEMMLNAKYSQSQEKEADDYGYNFLKRNGKNPMAMVRAFEKLKKMEGQTSGVSKYINKMFSSHPAMDERISRIREKCRKDGYK